MKGGESEMLSPVAECLCMISWPQKSGVRAYGKHDARLAYRNTDGEVPSTGRIGDVAGTGL